jgi:hypothetical protein
MDVRSSVGWFTASKHDTMMLFGLYPIHLLRTKFLAQFMTGAMLCDTNLVRDAKYVFRNNMRHAWPRKFSWLMMV